MKASVRRSPKALASVGLATGIVKVVKSTLKRRKQDDENIGLLSDPDIVLSEVKEWIPSMFPQLDYILGGGWPVGRAVEIFGPEGKGKSACAHMAIKGVQSIGGTAMILDFETALDVDKIVQLGIDPDRLIYATPEHIEQGWDIVWATVEKLEDKPPDAPFLIVWDSIAASVPAAELDEKKSSDVHVALIARAMSKGARKMYRQIARVRACMMWVNQVRDQIGKWGVGPQTTTPGGRAVKFAASIRLSCSYTKYIKLSQDSPPVGYEVFVKTVKNRLFPPHRKTSWVLDFQYGPSPELSTFRCLLDARKIKSAGDGYYKGSWSDHKFRRREGWFEALKDSEFRKGARATFAEVIEGVEPKKSSEGDKDV